MITNNAAYKYETQYNGTFVITHYWAKYTVTLHCDAIKSRHNIRHIKPYTSDKNVDDIKT